jgi:hypothetical protein
VGWVHAIFYHFPTLEGFGREKCRQISALGFARESLGSFYTAVVRRPLTCADFIIRDRSMLRKGPVAGRPFTAWRPLGLLASRLRQQTVEPCPARNSNQRRFRHSSGPKVAPGGDRQALSCSRSSVFLCALCLPAVNFRGVSASSAFLGVLTVKPLAFRRRAQSPAR